ncbi:hypothetical protein [Pajaroellobacter abortibovis]|uniref:Uncharacterized protein n=1 Tax=Pajaroellobacter abortibovis TaxID=1882918 RepID=A0A1L6MVS8_9BACT|nr:hypothetical protein [Pajaroellobacter abortibovis]APR99650.1 hypothetical protein BCY86_02395 [Pajaroellobacter abortibovis]
MNVWNEKVPSILAYAENSFQQSKLALHYLALHTGLPILVVASGAVVFSYHLFRRWAVLIFEFVVAFGLIGTATYFGWIHW